MLRFFKFESSFFRNLNRGTPHGEFVNCETRTQINIILSHNFTPNFHNNITKSFLRMGNKQKNCYGATRMSKYSRSKTNNVNKFIANKKHRDEIERLQAQLNIHEIQTRTREEELVASQVLALTREEELVATQKSSEEKSNTILGLQNSLRTESRKSIEICMDNELKNSKIQKLEEYKEKSKKAQKKSTRRIKDLTKSVDKSKFDKSQIAKQLNVEKKKTIISYVNNVDPDDLQKQIEAVGYSKAKLDILSTEMSVKAFNEFTVTAGANAMVQLGLAKLNRRKPELVAAKYAKFVEKTIDTFDTKFFTRIVNHVDELIKQENGGNLITVMSFIFLKLIDYYLTIRLMNIFRLEDSL